MRDPSVRLDTRGLECPLPTLRAVEAIRRSGGQKVVVVTDHAPALETVPFQAEWHGWDCVIEETGAPEWTLTLTPKEKAAP